MDERKSKTKETRAYSWGFIIYPESVPENWREIIDDKHIKWVESPLHDKDTNEDGEIKKPHWHILVTYESKKSYEQVKELTDELHAPVPQKAQSLRGLVRYMIHLDNPEKHQYSQNDIIVHGGADIRDALKPTSASRYQMISEMSAFVRVNSITEFCDLFDYAAEERTEDWFPMLCDSCAYVMGQYIKSFRFKIEIQNARNNQRS